MKKRTKVGAVLAVTGVLAVLPATAAFAVTYNGSKACQGTALPALSIDAKGPGTLTWVNRSTAATHSYGFLGGHSQKFSPYQQANWTAAASAGFYSAPTASCL